MRSHTDVDVCSTVTDAYVDESSTVAKLGRYAWHLVGTDTYVDEISAVTKQWSDMHGISWN